MVRPFSGKVLNNQRNKQTTVTPTTWMNLKTFCLVNEARCRGLHTVGSIWHSGKGKSLGIENPSVLPGAGGGGGLTMKRCQEIWGDVGIVLYLDCGGGCTTVFIYQNPHWKGWALQNIITPQKNISMGHWKRYIYVVSTNLKVKKGNLYIKGMCVCEWAWCAQRWAVAQCVKG